jgi:polysaccharide export outer membrane protein
MIRFDTRGAAWMAGLMTLSLLSAPPIAAQPEATEEAVSADSSSPETRSAASGPPLTGAEPYYRIGASDVLRVTVWRNPELSAEVPVRPDGRISVPLLGDIQADGFTTAELRDGIAEGLSEYITAPDVTVTVLQVNSKLAFLVGEVLRPTAVPLTRDMRVLDAISVVGGFSPYANRRKIRILRPKPDGSVEEIRFNYNRFVKGNDPGSNILLEPGDTIVVPD